MMPTSPDPVITSITEGFPSSASTIHVHHRHFPEIRAEGISAVAAARDLIRCLTSALDDTPDYWHRGALEQAIADVERFVDRGGSAS